MMYFKHTNIEERILFNPNVIYSVAIENPSFYYKFVTDLLNENDELITISVDEKPVPIKNNFVTITDPFSVDPNSKKYLTTLYKNADKQYLNPYRSEKLNSIQKDINDLLDDVGYDFDIPVTFSHDITLGNLLDAFDFKIKTEMESMLQRIVSFLRAIREISQTKFVFIIGFLDMIRDEEMDAFLKEASYLDFTIINVSSHLSKTDNERVIPIIIDNDLCEI